MIRLLVTGGLILGMAVAFFTLEFPDERLRVIACDVGQGDSILIIRSFSQIVIDGGPSSDVLACMGRYLPFWDRKIELLVLTHPQKDHMAGLVEVIERFQVEWLVTNGVAAETEDFKRLHDVVVRRGVKVFVPERNDRFMLGGIELKVLWPEDEVGESEALSGDVETLSRYSADNLGLGDVNQVSVVIELKYGGFDGLFTGDITEAEEKKLVAAGVLDEVELLKVAHHGSRYSSSSEFLDEVGPEVALVSVGERNSFGHPTREVLERLVAVGAKIHRTDEEGDVVVVSDGKRYWVEGQ